MSPSVEVVDQRVANAREREKDRKAWNLPAKPRETGSRVTANESDPDSGLDWESFSARYFKGSRRHDLKAIVAYAKYKQSSRHVSEKPDLAESVIREGPLAAWENEGGLPSQASSVIEKHQEDAPADSPASKNR